MQILTLTTDWNQQDYYIGTVKGFLVNTLPELKIVDISHDIPVFDYKKACYLVKSIYKLYPENTVHIIGVRGGADGEPAVPIITKVENQWFLGYDNGAFNRMFDKSENLLSWRIHDQNNSTFPEFDFLVKSAVAIIKGHNVDEIGVRFQLPVNGMINLPSITQNSIVGIAEYIDGYGNIITNINKSDFERIRAGRKFEIMVSRRQNVITRISPSYNDSSGNLVAVFNSLGKLEIAQINYKASYSLGIREDSIISVKFL